MSEYQYYEFQAIDRRLTQPEMLQLRACSTRANITPTSFVNEYHWGDFKGNQDAWMDKYFDAFLYMANWGTRILNLRLESRLLGLKTVKPFCTGQSLDARRSCDKVIVTFTSEDEDGDNWITGHGRLSSLVPLRTELARGDLRALYMGWLHCAQSGELDDDEIEPAIPPGLGQPSESLEALADFLRIDPDLITAAAEASKPQMDVRCSTDDLLPWVRELPPAEKDVALAKIVSGDGPSIGHELLQRFLKSRMPDLPDPQRRQRTVGQLLARAKEIARARARELARLEAEAAERRRREEAASRQKHLDSMRGRELLLWDVIECSIAKRQPQGYDAAVALLSDLRDLDARDGGTSFRPRLDALRDKHSGKRSLMDRLNKAGL